MMEFKFVVDCRCLLLLVIIITTNVCPLPTTIAWHLELQECHVQVVGTDNQ